MSDASPVAAVEDGSVHLTDPDCEFVAPGAAGDDRDLSSTASRRFGY